MNVIVKGPLLSVTGYGSHSRQVFAWAKSKGWNVCAQIVPWGMCTYYVDEDAEDGLIGQIMKASSPFPANVSADLSLQIQLPDEWDISLAKKNIGITAGVEADKCSQTWIEACKKMDHVIVPSTFSRQTFLNTGLDESHISCVPEAYTVGFKTDKYYDEFNCMLDSLPTKFNFLIFGQITGNNAENDRKNTFYNLKWLAEQFADDPDVGIIVKTNMGRLTVMDRMQTADTFTAVLKEVRKGPYPRFYLAHGLMDRNEMRALFTHEKMKALVAPTRGEGWGLPILDAAVCGMPVIATNYSGHLDFMKNVKFLDLEYDMVPVPESQVDGRVWQPNTKWAHVREEHFKRRLKKFRSHSDLPTSWAKSSAPMMREKFGLQSIFDQYNQVIGGAIDKS